MIRNVILGFGAIGLLVFGQIDAPGSSTERWIMNTGAFGLCIFMVIRFSAAIEKLSGAITALRIHCATKIGKPEQNQDE